MSTMHPKGALILRKHVGEADGPNGEKFEMSLMNGFVPCVKDLKTGKSYVIDWQDLVGQAVAAGVSKPDRDIAHEQLLADNERADNGGVNSGRALS